MVGSPKLDEPACIGMHGVKGQVQQESRVGDCVGHILGYDCTFQVICISYAAGVFALHGPPVRKRGGG